MAKLKTYFLSIRLTIDEFKRVQYFKLFMEQQFLFIRGTFEKMMTSTF